MSRHKGEDVSSLESNHKRVPKILGGGVSSNAPSVLYLRVGLSRVPDRTEVRNRLLEKLRKFVLSVDLISKNDPGPDDLIIHTVLLTPTEKDELFKLLHADPAVSQVRVHVVQSA